jgi:hypothetical protein
MMSRAPARNNADVLPKLQEDLKLDFFCGGYDCSYRRNEVVRKTMIRKEGRIPTKSSLMQAYRNSRMVTWLIPGSYISFTDSS